MPIRILPEAVSSAIAAGEVVERPSSVVKELIENSLDAGATHIEITVEAGGKRLIEVQDDGAGIPARDVPLAIARHATSKLNSLDDLQAIQTLGFRGEALSAICAVSRLELVTRHPSDDAGTRLRSEGGGEARREPIGAPRGTVVRVRDLFYNVPARREFLKTDATERRRISDLVSRYALAYPGVRFRLIQEGRESLYSSGSGDRREALAAALGEEMARSMVALPEQGESAVRVEGFVGPATVHRSSRKHLIFFVNGRWVQDNSLSAAVLGAYHGLLMVGRYPVAALFIGLPSREVDINVHPTKSEIRFRNQNQVFTVVQRSVRAVLLGQAPPPVEMETQWRGRTPAAGAQTISPDWQIAHDLLEINRTERGFEPQPALPQADVPLLRPVGQVGAAYLVAEGPDGIYLIDQHAAHERILFEGLMSAREESRLESQALLEPELIEFSPSEAAIIDQHLEGMRDLGFDVEHFGGHTYRLRTLPAMLSNLSPHAAMRVLVDDFEEDEAPLEAEAELRIAARVCKRSAIKAGQILSASEQRKLLRDLEACEAPRTCPHGRPTMIHLSVQSLERQFGRRG